MRTVAVIGAAAGDCVLSVARMPRSGEDIAAHDHGWQIGGCAFNVLRALARLQLPIINGIRVGNGQWGQRVRQALSELGVSPFFVSETQDNGWCFALTEPNGERTFISIAGCEEEWNREELQTLALPNDSIIYASGYELGCLQGEALQQWLLVPSIHSFGVTNQRWRHVVGAVHRRWWRNGRICVYSRRFRYLFPSKGCHELLYHGVHHITVLLKRLNYEMLGEW